MKATFYDSEFLIAGKQNTLAQWRDKTLLIVNSATQCALASQFTGLQNLHEKFHEQGLVVIAFPCDQFFKQEPETDQSMTQVCQLNFGVSFDIAHKIAVNGQHTHPIFQYLKSQAPGIFGSEKIKWNFTKFLVSPGASQIKRYSPSVKPENLIEEIEIMCQST